MGGDHLTFDDFAAALLYDIEARRLGPCVGWRCGSLGPCLFTQMIGRMFGKSKGKKLGTNLQVASCASFVGTTKKLLQG